MEYRGWLRTLKAGPGLVMQKPYQVFQMEGFNKEPVMRRLEEQQEPKGSRDNLEVSSHRWYSQSQEHWL